MFLFENTLVPLPRAAGRPAESSRWHGNHMSSCASGGRALWAEHSAGAWSGERDAWSPASARRGAQVSFRSPPRPVSTSVSPACPRILVAHVPQCSHGHVATQVHVRLLRGFSVAEGCACDRCPLGRDLSSDTRLRSRLCSLSFSFSPPPDPLLSSRPFGAPLC